MKVVITVPKLTESGGVSSLFNILKLDKIKGITYFEIRGNHVKRKTGFLRFIDLMLVYYRFFHLISSNDLIHINPSMNKKCFFRDGLFLLLARLKNKKVLIYWHGWSDAFEHKINKFKFLELFFKKTFAVGNIHIVLGKVFLNKLVNLGINRDNIRIESNTADDSLVNCMINRGTIRNPIKNILFLSRIEKEKGIQIAIDTINVLNLKNNDSVKLIVAGEGKELLASKKYVKENKIPHIDFIGHIANLQKHYLFIEADILLLPTYHHEGMPIVIIESMLYGLPIVSRPVGGIPDWVKEKENGFLLTSKDHNDFVEILNYLIKNPETVADISLNNQQKAREFFLPDVVRKRILSYYDHVINVG